MSDAKRNGHGSAPIPLGNDRFLLWGRGPREAGAIGRPLPPARARAVLRDAFRRDGDVRARVLGLHLESAGAPAAHAVLSVQRRDLERALSWALAAVEPASAGAARLDVLERERPRVADFTPVGSPPPKPKEPPVADKLSYLEFEVLDQRREPHVGAAYSAKLPDGDRRGQLSAAGYVFIDGLKPGSYNVAFPTAPPPVLDETDFFDIEMVSALGQPLAGFAYVATLPDGTRREGVLGPDGRARLSGVPPGDCTVTFPALEKKSG